MKGPILCAVLVAVVYYPKLVVMNTTLSLCVSGYHRYHLLYVDLKLAGIIFQNTVLLFC